MGAQSGYVCCIWCGKDKPKGKSLSKFCSNKCRYEATGKRTNPKAVGKKKN